MKVRQVSPVRLVFSGIRLNKKAKELKAPTEIAVDLVYVPDYSTANAAARQAIIDHVLALVNGVKKKEKKSVKVPSLPKTLTLEQAAEAICA